MLREIYYQFLVYRSLIVPFLVASSIAVPVWLIFRLYRLRARGHRVSFKRESVLVIFVAYLACLAAATLAPNGNPRLRAADSTGIELRPDLATLTCSAASIPDSRARHFCMYNTKGNVLLFLPLGFLLPLIWTRIGILRGLQAALAISVTIEILQLVSRTWDSYRAVDINDVILNVAGAFLGLLIVYVLRLITGARPAVARA